MHNYTARPALQVAACPESWNGQRFLHSPVALSTSTVMHLHLYAHNGWVFFKKNFLGMSSFYHSSLFTLAKLLKRFYTALLFAAGWGWIQTTLLCPDLTLFRGLNWRSHKPVPGSYRITQNFYLSAWNNVIFFLLYFKVLISQNISEDSQYITGLFKNFYKDTNKS